MEITSSKKLWNLDSSSDMVDVEKRRKKIPRSNLINSLNRINFKNGDIVFKFKHKKYNNYIILKAKPQTCNDNLLECLWSEPSRIQSKWKLYDLEGFSFNDGLNQIEVQVQLVDYNDAGLIVELPEYSYEMQLRAVKRHLCKEVSAQISQEGIVVAGGLINFCGESFAIQYCSQSTPANLEINTENSANIVLMHKGEFIFSGKCTIIRQEKHANKSILVFKPEKDNIRKKKFNEHRTERLVLSPLPNLVFNHPLIQKKISLGLNDISALGFSVEEDSENSILLPGLIIPELKIELIHGMSISCKAQVIYRIPNGDVVRCGMVILDMNMQDHIKLSSLIHKAKNKHSSIDCTNIDLDALWDFFFDTGFVYPSKYIHIAEQKDKFLSIYKKLYNENPEISRYVIYQDKGKIYGHVAMLRYYQKTWLIHHHAAVKTTKNRAGLVVIEHIMQYINEIHSLPSAKIKYIGIYFRPDNRFAKRVFETTIRSLNDIKKSSIDEFAYYYIHHNVTKNTYSGSLSLSETDLEELEIFQDWYDEISGGLLIKALDLDTEAHLMDESICRDYVKAGLKREKKLFSLKKNDDLLAILIVNISDFGLNMSELTNCIQFFVLDQNQLDKHSYNFAIEKIVQFYEYTTVPVLLYPKSFAEKHQLPFEKTYFLGLLNLDYLNECLDVFLGIITPKKSDIFYAKIVKRLNNLQD